MESGDHRAQLYLGLSTAGLADGAGISAFHMHPLGNFIAERAVSKDEKMLQSCNTDTSGDAISKTKRSRCSSSSQSAKTRPAVCDLTTGCMNLAAGRGCDSLPSLGSLSLPRYSDLSSHSAGMHGGEVVRFAAARAGSVDEEAKNKQVMLNLSTDEGDEEVVGKVKHLRGLEKTNRRLKNDVMLLRLEVELLRQIVELSREDNIAENHVDNAVALEEMSGNDFVAYMHTCTCTHHSELLRMQIPTVF
jgi:hypothetical protein